MWLIREERFVVWSERIPASHLSQSLTSAYLNIRATTAYCSFLKDLSGRPLPRLNSMVSRDFQGIGRVGLQRLTWFLMETKRHRCFISLDPLRNQLLRKHILIVLLKICGVFLLKCLLLPRTPLLKLANLYVLRMSSPYLITVSWYGMNHLIAINYFYSKKISENHSQLS